MRKILNGYEASEVTKAEYCRRSGITIRTLDYYRRKPASAPEPGLIRVKVDQAPRASGGFVLVLGNGRRIESDWNFGEAELTQLIRVAEGT